MRHRPPDREEHTTIVAYLKAGNYFETACAAAGVRVSLGRSWLVEGVDPESGTHDFLIDVRQAMAEAEAKLVEFVHDAGSADWKAALAMLERRYPERWALKIKHVVEEQLSAAVGRVESLEEEIGREAVDLVLDALAGDVRGPEAEGSEEAGLH